MVAPFIIAIGDAPSKSLPAASTVNIAPADDSVDTNRVIITGSGTISSFGVACGGLTRAEYLNDPNDVAATSDVITVTKRVTFVPDPGQTITLHHNPPALSLYSLADRAMTGRCFATYESDQNGNWQETSFLTAPIIPGVAPPPSGEFWGYAAAGGSTPIGIPARVTYARVQMWGGTGGSGGTDSGGGGSGGSGAAGYLEKFLSGLTPGATLSFTCGAGGAPGAAGGASVLQSGSQSIPTLTANPSGPGSFGNSNTGAINPGSAGGAASGGDFNVTGQSGSNGTAGGLTGVGGSTMYSVGADGTTGASGNPGHGGGVIITWSN